MVSSTPPMRGPPFSLEATASLGPSNDATSSSLQNYIPQGIIHIDDLSYRNSVYDLAGHIYEQYLALYSCGDVLGVSPTGREDSSRIAGPYARHAMTLY